MHGGGDGDDDDDDDDDERILGWSERAFLTVSITTSCSMDSPPCPAPDAMTLPNSSAIGSPMNTPDAAIMKLQCRA